MIASVWFYNNFPETVAIHWDVYGEADNWASRGVAVFLFPAIILAVYIMFLALPKLDPKKERYTQFAKPYLIFKDLIVFFLVFLYFLTGLVNIGYDIALDVWIPISIGIMFIILGNYMAKIKMNWFVGIKTPWTLSSEEVWNKTHRVGGKAFILGGLLLASTAFVRDDFVLPVFLLMLAVILFGTIGYSYIVYLQEKKKDNKNN